MKKTAMIFAAGALALAACTSTEQKPASVEQLMEQQLAKATNFKDSLTAIDGTWMGAYWNYSLHSAPADVQRQLNMKEVERGVRMVMEVDTANMSLLYGIQVGVAMYETYNQIAREEKVSKAELMKAIMAGLRLDSVDRDELLNARSLFFDISAQVDERAKERAQAEAMNSREASENRQLADAVEASLKASPDYKAVEGGIYKKQITAATDSVINRGDRVKVSYTIKRLNDQHITDVKTRSVFVGHTGSPVLDSVLPYMTKGETAEFFVPYTAAYGVEGNSETNVGPCESLKVSVSVQ